MGVRIPRCPFSVMSESSSSFALSRFLNGGVSTGLVGPGTVRRLMRAIQLCGNGEISLAMGVSGVAYACWRTEGMRLNSRHEMVV
jgi:hypothetical protein